MEVTGIVPALRDGPLRDREGLLLGRVEDLLFDAQTNRPAWLVVRLSGPDERRTLVPAPRARAGVDGLYVAHDADAVRACPVRLTGPVPLREHVLGAGRHYGARRFGRGESFTSAAAARDTARVA
ncbi:MAG TPA: PRC-barrel domain-containing protein [Baekduia sp.]|nr:PRC-barrel domain-containing protein [Baekduia sp.]